MKQMLVAGILFLYAITAFAQKAEPNGTIYISHPNIEVVNKTVKAYLEKDIKTNASLFADTATFWASGMEKEIPIAEAFKQWASDFDFYDSIKLTKVGYPDFLHYKDKDQKWVQSWWKWSGKSKKSGEQVTIDFVQFDRFNNDGKIVMEGLYGDFSKLEKQ